MIASVGQVLIYCSKCKENRYNGKNTFIYLSFRVLFSEFEGREGHFTATKIPCVFSLRAFGFTSLVTEAFVWSYVFFAISLICPDEKELQHMITKIKKEN